MENNFNKIRILREEIQQSHKESETLCKNNPIILNSLKKITFWAPAALFNSKLTNLSS